MILVANKIDLVHLRKISEEEGRELAAELQIPYIETSAKVPPVNVDIAFQELVRVIRQQNQNQNPVKKKRKKTSIYKSLSSYVTKKTTREKMNDIFLLFVCCFFTIN
jgi:GTPase SAR1 family protein